MKLIKLTDDHYVVVDETKEIQTNDKYLTSDNRIVNWHKEFEENIKENRPSPITHSTQPLESVPLYKMPNGELIDEIWYDKIQQLSLSEVKELIGEVDVEKRIYDTDFRGDVNSYKKGYNQALEDNKEKKYTEEDLQKAFTHCAKYSAKCIASKIDVDFLNELEMYLESIQPKTEWKVEIVDGKLKLK